MKWIACPIVRIFIDHRFRLIHEYFPFDWIIVQRTTRTPYNWIYNGIVHNVSANNFKWNRCDANVIDSILSRIIYYFMVSIKEEGWRNQHRNPKYFKFILFSVKICFCIEFFFNSIIIDRKVRSLKCMLS